MKTKQLKKGNLQGLDRTGDLKIQGYPYSLALYQLSYPEILLCIFVQNLSRLVVTRFVLQQEPCLGLKSQREEHVKCEHQLKRVACVVEEDPHISIHHNACRNIQTRIGARR